MKHLKLFEEYSMYYEFQIRIKDESAYGTGTTFSNSGGRIQKSY